MKSEKSVMGRPTDYKEEYCEIALNFLKLGKSRTQLASHLDVAKSTVQLWEKIHKDFSAAIKLGLTHAEARWMDKGEENLDTKHFSCRMYELQMMNRFGWSRKMEQNLNEEKKQEDAIQDLE